jgi:hypothetical protein
MTYRAASHQRQHAAHNERSASRTGAIVETDDVGSAHRCRVSIHTEYLPSRLSNSSQRRSQDGPCMFYGLSD